MATSLARRTIKVRWERRFRMQVIETTSCSLSNSNNSLVIKQQLQRYLQVLRSGEASIRRRSPRAQTSSLMERSWEQAIRLTSSSHQLSQHPKMLPSNRRSPTRLSNRLELQWRVAISTMPLSQKRFHTHQTSRLAIWRPPNSESQTSQRVQLAADVRKIRSFRVRHCRETIRIRFKCAAESTRSS